MTTTEASEQCSKILSAPICKYNRRAKVQTWLIFCLKPSVPRINTHKHFLASSRLSEKNLYTISTISILGVKYACNTSTNNSEIFLRNFQCCSGNTQNHQVLIILSSDFQSHIFQTTLREAR